MSEPTSSILRFVIPQDQDLQAAVGKIALCHALLDHFLKMTIKTLTGVSRQEALDGTARQGSAELRRRVRKVACKRFGEGEVLVKVDALLQRSKRATDKRNDFLHGLWTEDAEGSVMLTDKQHVPNNAPSTAELEGLAAELAGIAKELNTARLKGFLHDALAVDGPLRNSAPAKSEEKEEENGQDS